METVIDGKAGKAFADRLEKLGFVVTAHRLREAQERKRKLAIAYEHYRFVRQENIDTFNARLKKETFHQGQFGRGSYSTLLFVLPQHYARGIPPADVIDKMEAAKDRNCFDSFEIAYIEEVKEDPILFGRVNGCPDRFFVAEWDNDVKISDLIKENEG